MSIPIVYVTRQTSRSAYTIFNLDHVHVLETGECIKDRAGDCPIAARLNKDPFRKSKTLDPHSAQNDLIMTVLPVVEALLKSWGRQSGKTTARLMLAKAIIDGDGPNA